MRSRQRGRRNALVGALGAVSAVLARAGAAHAQSATLAGTPPAPVSLEGPALAAKASPNGLSLGAFSLQPALRLSTAYDDNIYSRTTGKISDAAFTARPSIDVQSNWLSNSLNFHADTILTRYAENSQNNSNQYQVSSDGSLTINRLWMVSGSANYSHVIEARGTPGNDFTAGRYGYADGLNLDAKATFRLNRLLLSASAGTNRLRYEDVRNDDIVFDQSYRNHHLDTVLLRADYQIDATTSVFVSVSTDRYLYSHDNGGRDRSSKGLSTLVGVNTELTRLIKGEIGIGYVRQNYKQAGFNSYAGFNYSGNVVYTVTPLTTVTVTGDRSLLNSALQDVANVISSEFTLAVQHELTQNVTLQANAEHDTEQYRGISRTDHLMQLGLSANYVLNRFVTFAPYYTYRNRSSSGDLRGRSYHDNRIGATLILTP